ncbi:unnamed protein product [marine sediment metagenome]|uniref:Uncharacterized protein n=1 Tax=marine sediment metagenome TaxID=412755 RepID=X0TL16_9ZZZZ
MVSKEAMVIFYRACNYGEWDSIQRAGRYMNLQTKFNNAREALEEMTSEDEYQLQLREKENER